MSDVVARRTDRSSAAPTSSELGEARASRSIRSRFERRHTISAAGRRATAQRTHDELEAERVETITSGRILGDPVVRQGELPGAVGRPRAGSRSTSGRTRCRELDFQIFKLLDFGDWVGVEGRLFRTKTNELTIWASRLHFLAKCLLPLPEKWHGLTDVEIRYRQRYLDLIVNPESRRVFETRSRVVAAIREFMTRAAISRSRRR